MHRGRRSWCDLRRLLVQASDRVGRPVRLTQLISGYRELNRDEQRVTAGYQDRRCIEVEIVKAFSVTVSRELSQRPGVDLKNPTWSLRNSVYAIGRSKCRWTKGRLCYPSRAKRGNNRACAGVRVATQRSEGVSCTNLGLATRLGEGIFVFASRVIRARPTLLGSVSWSEDDGDPIDEGRT